MFCNQCEQAAHTSGCTTDPGVCAKSEDAQSLQETLLYGLKGIASYCHHARRLGRTCEEVNAFIEEGLFATMTNVNFNTESLLEMVFECGRRNLLAMELLDDAHVEAFGTPEPSTVAEGTREGPGILVTGHDLLDLKNLLDQCHGTEISLYTNGEMLAAHMYPTLRDHPNLVGHYGGAWQQQKVEFGRFSGPILATGSCIQVPRESYADRVYSTRCTSFPAGQPIHDDDFSKVISHATRCTPLGQSEIRESTVGFHHNVILERLTTIAAALTQGQMSRLFVIGGCDGAEPGRNYFSNYAQATPEDSLILTMGCGKYRIRNEDYGELLGLPRLLDMGQCNDALGAIKVAYALAEALACPVSDVPMTFVISWFDQKTFANLLTLLALGFRGVTLGPNAPAFMTPSLLNLLQQNHGLRLTGFNAEADLAMALGQQQT